MIEMFCVTPECVLCDVETIDWDFEMLRIVGSDRCPACGSASYVKARSYGVGNGQQFLTGRHRPGQLNRTRTLRGWVI